MSLAIVTGSSSGLGLFTALKLAANFERIVVTSRLMARAEDACRRLQIAEPNANFIPFELRLQDLDRVKKFAESVVRDNGNWNLLVNNAGAKIEKPTKLTEQGFEWHYGVNHLSHFALTSFLKNHASTDARVVSTSSIVARKGNPSNWSDGKSSSPAEQYAASKLANLCFALELNERTDLISTAAHPGFARAEPYGNSLVRVGEYLLAQTAEAGAAPLVTASGAERGHYLGPRVFELWGKPKLVPLPSSASLANRNYLWELSEAQLGQKF